MKNRITILAVVFALLVAVVPAYAQLGGQTIAIGETVEGTLENSTTDYTLSLAAGEGVVLTTESLDFSPELSIALEGSPIVSSENFSGRITFIAAETGDYTITVSDYQGAAGTGTFSLTAAALLFETIQLNEPIEGTINATTGYQISFDANECWVAQLVAPTGDFDSYLELLNPEGLLVASNDDGGNRLNSWLPYCTREAGQHTLIATAFYAEPVGTFILVVETTTPLSFTNPAGETVEGFEETTWNTNDFSVEYTVEMAAEQTIAATATADSTSLYLELVDTESESTLSTSDFSDTGSVSLSYTAETAGSYRLIVYNYDATAESTYTISVREAPAPIFVEDIGEPSFGATEPVERGAIAVGDTVNGNAEGGNEIYSLTLDSETFVTIALESTEFDAYLSVEDIEGIEIDYNDDGGGDLNSLLEITLTAGEYRVVVSSFSGSPFGSYTLSIN